MSRKKQNILVLVQDNDSNDIALQHSFRLARLFKSEVAIAFLESHKKEGKAPVNNNEIDAINKQSIPYRIIELKNTNQEPNRCIQEVDAILIVSQFSKNSLGGLLKRNFIFNWITKAKIPSILVSEQTNPNCEYKNIIVPVDHRKESKEKMIWASYFGRFNQAFIHLLAANEKSEGYIRNVKATLIFTKKMFKQFAFEYKILKAASTSKNINKEAIQFSKQFNSDLIILMSSRNPSWFDSYSGPAKLKRILKKEPNPILIINPLKDYYLPCN
ncbi:hypothetical protein [Labilibaculum sp.]|uniref:hypothetical protein n=1 Tax=Labilibaculum sp. TaxID=2060723 RepID=UPI00356533BC